MNYNFFIIGGDKRLTKLGEKLKRDGNNVRTYGNIIEGTEEVKFLKKDMINGDEVIISSVPLSKDGINVYMPLSDKKLTIAELSEFTKDNTFIAGQLNNKIIGNDILADERYAILNTISTAEGAIQVAMEETTYELSNSKVMVLGFGKVAKTLCNKLERLGLDVYVMARKEIDLAWIEAYGYKPIKKEELTNNICKMDIIFNTIPSIILDKGKLIFLNKETLIVELASKPRWSRFRYRLQIRNKSCTSTRFTRKSSTRFSVKLHDGICL